MSNFFQTPRRRFLLFIIGLMLLWTLVPGLQPPVYAQQDLISLNVQAGYDSYYRSGFWTPLRVSITNNGDPIEGRLIARQERNAALTNTFSTPVTLPSGAQQSFFLYVTLQSSGSSVLLELLDQNDAIAAEIEVPIRHVAARDRIRAVVTESPNSPIDLIRSASGGNQVFQVNWFTSNIPDKPEALRGIEVIIFSDVDTGTLTPAQRTAIENWVLLGGQLIVTGGANWQPAASAFAALLPLTPNGTAQVTDLTGLAPLGGDTNPLQGASTITVGNLLDDASLLAATSDDLPLYVRRSYGDGTIDYLTADLSAEPLRRWQGLDQLWFTVFTSIDARPGWFSGFADIDNGIDSVEILPGFSALPEATGMFGFLVIYILLVGPVNYLVLNRINRRELAWITIPALIIVFSILAWITGFNLRGNDVILSRMSAVHVWPGQDTAYAEQLIGLLAPRRGNYSLTVSDDRVLRPVMRTGQTSQLFGAGTQTTEISETTQFAALEFPVDASFIAAFESGGPLPSPDISGRLTLNYAENGMTQYLRGTIRNNSDLTLESPVLLARGDVFRLNRDLAPGDLYVLEDSDLTLVSTGPAAASPVEYALREKFTAFTRYYYSASSRGVVRSDETVRDIFGENYIDTDFGYLVGTPNADQTLVRRQKFLNALIGDQFNSTARGNNVYLVAWTSLAPFEEGVGGASWRSIDDTAYIIQLAVDPASPQDSVLVSGNQFTWAAVQREGALDASPTNTTLYSDSIAGFRFTPLPNAILSEVERLYIRLDQDGDDSRDRDMGIELWNWQTQTWVQMEITEGRNRIFQAEQFIGPLNAVQVRINRDQSGGSYFYLRQLTIEQQGRF